ncbi:PQQ-like beta-propeller repeat protein [Nocardioides albidus]|uniref:PQQ-like beta-propeller repeat protein n=1 Tax=Nocardioides albidus TaxID=1517589 RepID=A0A5C4VT21_9ACTN|nr:PQQ-like beta-propeller repeat protein [Nocardioides albidus]
MWTDDHLVTLAGDHVLRGHRRTDLGEAWSVTLRRDDYGISACYPPAITPDDVVVLFLSQSCGEVVAYDAATGELLSDESVFDGEFTEMIDHADHVVGTTRVGERLWFAGFSTIGYISADGAPVVVLDEEALGFAEDAHSLDRVSAITSTPGGDQLIVAFARRDEANDEVVGYDIAADGPTLTQAWQVKKNDSTPLGAAHAKLPGHNELRGLHPGGLRLIDLKGGATGLGVPDDSGAVPHPAVIPAGRKVSATSPVLPRPEFLVGDGVLYVSADSARRRYGFRAIEAYDLTTGDLIWRTVAPAPPDDGSNIDVYTVQDLTLGEDGLLYAASAATADASTLVRLDPDTGEVLHTWALPDGYEVSSLIRVVGDTVVTVQDDIGVGADAALPGVSFFRPAA